MKKHDWYFVKQKLMGVALLILAVITAIVLDGDITASAIIVPMAFMLIFTKEMIVNDSYYFEMMEEQERRKS